MPSRCNACLIPQTVNEIWLASPDIQSRKAVSLYFDQKEGEISFTLPSLSYWDMVVIEYE
ncbi:glycoside hydrolase family 66 protein [Bacillus sp. JJ1122]|uniref:glycoside hydrolase family 66 protein n=1 Tax=Bacillus sp. JJ1122 TaxID=3122951 RepID=UPI003F68A276